jgi:hypothetical protein
MHRKQFSAKRRADELKLATTIIDDGARRTGTGTGTGTKDDRVCGASIGRMGA